MGRPRKLEDGKSVNVLQDALWVYANAKVLFRPRPRSEGGGWTIEDRYADQAPSSGAWILAQYACNHFKEFCEKFVIRLLPKDAGKEQEQRATSSQLDELDPEFSTLEQFLKPLKDTDETSEMESEPAEETGSEHRLPQTSASLGDDAAESSIMVDGSLSI